MSCELKKKLNFSWHICSIDCQKSKWLRFKNYHLSALHKEAERLPKKGGRQSQPNIDITCDETQRFIWNNYRTKSKSDHPIRAGHKKDDAYNQLYRSEPAAKESPIQQVEMWKSRKSETAGLRNLWSRARLSEILQEDIISAGKSTCFY